MEVPESHIQSLGDSGGCQNTECMSDLQCLKESNSYNRNLESKWLS